MTQVVGVLSTGNRLKSRGIRREARRKFIVRAVFFLFLLSMIEGPLRKWFLPGLAGPLTLLRDPFVISLYLYALWHGFFKANEISRMWFWFALMTAVLGAIQYNINGHGVVGLALGLRSYWLYMPLAFLIGNTFRFADVIALLRTVLLLAIPYSMLVATQYNAPSNSFVNLGVAGDQDGAVRLIGDVFRPFGVFTYTAPNVQYTGFSVAIFLAYLLALPIRKAGPIFLLISGLCIGVMTILTGSRTIFFIVVGILIVLCLGLFSSRADGRSIKIIAIIGSFAGIMALMVVTLFPDMLTAMQTRIELASAAEGGVLSRIYYTSFTFIDAYTEAQLLGYGIGAGAPGVSTFLNLPPFFLGESDTQRNVRELGLVMGIAFLVLRWWTSAWVVLGSIKLARKSMLLSLPIAGYVALPLSLGQLTSSPINSFLIWMSLGLIAAINHPPKFSKAERLHLRQPR